jgi:CRISPR-associated endoribonuclease Cas6
MNFRIDGYTLNPRQNPWAGQTSFAELAQDGHYEKIPRYVRMDFVSPTAFRNNRRDVSLPIPGKVFRSLVEKWNTFCPEPMQIDGLWTEFAEDNIIVSEMTAVNTVHWEFAEGTRGAATGFTGTVGFTLLPKSNIRENWKPYWNGADVVMHSLTRYSFYCGVGHHTTIGMGQTRSLSIDIDRN